MPEPSSINLSADTVSTPYSADAVSEWIWEIDLPDQVQEADSADLSKWISEPAGSPAEVWGDRSVISAQVLPRGEGLVSLSDETEPWQITISMVVLICFYSYILYRFRRDILTSLRNISQTEDTLTLMEGQGADFVFFLRSGIVLLVFSCSSVFMTWMEGLMPEIPNYYLFGASIFAFAAVVLYQWIALRVMCWFTEMKEMFREVRFIRRLNITLIALLYTPLAIIIGLSERFFIPGVLILGILFTVHFISLYKYFRLRFFSKLQYILYLCTIEILPFSFLIALVVRSQVSGIY